LGNLLSIAEGGSAKKDEQTTGRRRGIVEGKQETKSTDDQIRSGDELKRDELWRRGVKMN